MLSKWFRSSRSFTSENVISLKNSLKTSAGLISRSKASYPRRKQRLYQICRAHSDDLGRFVRSTNISVNLIFHRQFNGGASFDESQRTPTKARRLSEKQILTRCLEVHSTLPKIANDHEEIDCRIFQFQPSKERIVELGTELTKQTRF